MKDRLGITKDDVSELAAELEALRPSGGPSKRQFTAEQDEALLAARACEPGRRVYWDVLANWWEIKWGKVNADTLRRRLRELQEERGDD